MPTRTAAELIQEVRDLKRHRGIVHIGEQEILHMLGRGAGGEWTVLNVFAEPAMYAIGVVVAHPSLPEVIEGCEARALDVDPPRWQREVVVHDGALYERSQLTFAGPRNPLAGVIDDATFDSAHRNDVIIRELTSLVSLLARRLRDTGVTDNIPV